MALSFVIMAVSEHKEANRYFDDIGKSVTGMGGDVASTRIMLPDECLICEEIGLIIENNEGNIIVIVSDPSEKEVLFDVNNILNFESVITPYLKNCKPFKATLACLESTVNNLADGYVCIRNCTLIISMSGSPTQVALSLEQIGAMILQIMYLIAECERIQETEKSFSDNIYGADLVDIHREALSFMKRSSSLINVEDAQKIIRDVVNKDPKSIRIQMVSLNDVYGRISSDDIYSKYDVPPFRTAARHGYAVVASDGKGIRKVLKMESKSIPFALESGTCTWVKSGARIPDGATAVIQIANIKSAEKEYNNDNNDTEENNDNVYDHAGTSNTENNSNNNNTDNNNTDNDKKSNDSNCDDMTSNKSDDDKNSDTDENEYTNVNNDTNSNKKRNNSNSTIKVREDEIEIITEPEERENIKPIGCEIGTGDKIVSKYTRIGIAEIGLLASCGYKCIKVTKNPYVGVLSIGDYLQEPGETLKHNYTYDCNRITLLSLLSENGLDCANFGITASDALSITDRIKFAIKRVDILVTTGFANDKDILKPILKSYFQATIHFGGVNMKPGKSTTFATCKIDGKEKYILCLSGNPGSIPCAAYLFVLPLANELRCYFNASVPLIPGYIQETRYLLHSRPKYVWTNIIWRETIRTARVYNLIGKPFDLLSYPKSNALLKLPSHTSDLRTVFGKALPVRYFHPR